jgi:hypothetical protein
VKTRIDGNNLVYKKRTLTSKRFRAAVGRLNKQGHSNTEIVKAMAEATVLVNAIGRKPATDPALPDQLDLLQK